MIGFDLAARFSRRPLDLLAAGTRFLGGEEATEPPVTELADTAKRSRADPPSQMSRGLTGRGWTTAELTAK